VHVLDLSLTVEVHPMERDGESIGMQLICQILVNSHSDSTLASWVSDGDSGQLLWHGRWYHSSMYAVNAGVRHQEMQC
jgi:hypothetical protein